MPEETVVLPKVQITVGLGSDPEKRFHPEAIAAAQYFAWRSAKSKAAKLHEMCAEACVEDDDPVVYPEYVSIPGDEF